MGWPVLSMSRTTVRSDCDQPAGGPSDECDQSCARISAPISPPPIKKRRVRSSVPAWERPRSRGAVNSLILPDRRPLFLEELLDDGAALVLEHAADRFKAVVEAG